MKYNVSTYYIYFILLLLTSCSYQVKNKKRYNLTSITLKRNLSVSADSLNAIVSPAITGLTVDKQGNIYLRDQEKAKIIVLNPKGDYLATLGKKGRGPGEFEDISNIYIDEDTLYVLEIRPNRLTEFNLDNKHLIRTIPFPKITFRSHPIGYPFKIYPLKNNHFEILFRNNAANIPINPRITFSIVNYNLKPINTRIHQFPSAKAFTYKYPNGGILPFNDHLLPISITKFGPKGNVYDIWTDSLNIQVFDTSNAKVKDISAHYSPPKLTSDDVDSVVKGLPPFLKKYFHKAVEESSIKMPTHWPPINNLLVDNQGRCWVEFLNPGKQKQTWWVFDKNGQPKWTFKLNRHVHLYVIHNEEAYGIWEKRGHYSRIMRYKIEGMN